MDLWIRNQKGRLTKISDIMQPIEDKFDNIRGWVLYAVKQSDAMFPLGIYKSKERALEVLDEIQRIIEMHILVQTSTEWNVWYKGTVYEMPKE